MTYIGEIHVASVLELEDGMARLVIKGRGGDPDGDDTASVDVPEHMVEPLKDQVDDLGLVYGDGPTGDDLVGWDS